MLCLRKITKVSVVKCNCHIEMVILRWFVPPRLSHGHREGQFSEGD